MTISALVLFAFLYLPASYLATAIHELGHYLGCRIQKITPFHVSIGTGKIRFKFSRKGTCFYFKTMPFAGEIVVAPGYIKKMGLYGVIFMFIAGPAAQLLFAILLTYVGQSSIQAGPLQTAFWYTGLSIAIDAILQLIPFRRNTGKSNEFRSDGFHIQNFYKRRHQFKVVNKNW